jgi:hypothetical protein
MPWWGWLIVGIVVWLTLLVVGVYLIFFRQVIRVQQKVFNEMPDVNLGPPRRAGTTEAFAPRHRHRPTDPYP